MDAAYFKVRGNYRIISKAFITTFVVNAEGRYEILGFKVYEKESAGNWTDFLNGLKKCGSIINDCQDVVEKAMKCLDEVFENSMTAMMLPVGLCRSCRTSNSIERLNREMKRRPKPICVFSNEASVIRLMGSVFIEQYESFGNGGRKVFSSEACEKIMRSKNRSG